jgi:chromosome segregation ATPase
MNTNKINERQKIIDKIDETQSSINSVNQAIIANKDEKNRLIIKVNELKSALNDFKLENQELTVSDHAVLRFIERYTDINIEDLKKSILTDSNKKMIGAIGDGKYPINGFTATVKNNIIVTIY